jgi:predicted PurR-regulated permease PerM
MRLTMGQQLRYWGIAAAVFLAALWLLGDVLLPFVAGAAVAYFLNPLVVRLVGLGLPRLAATTLIALLLAAAVVLAGLLIVPAVVGQAAQLVDAAPDILARLQEFLARNFPGALDAESTLRRSLDTLGDAIQERGGELLQRLLTSARGVVSAVIFIIVTPVVAFYLLLDWPRVVARIDGLLPRQHEPVIRQLARDIDRAIAGFVRGQLTVCLILAVYYAGALMLAGLQYGLVVGVVTGLISFIPFIGAIVGGTLAIGLALFQFWGDPLAIGVVVVIFIAGQILEGNFLVPNLVGRSVGLHPVWLLFALSAFGTLFGFTGLLVAVPVAAALGVLARFAAERYRESRLYLGNDEDSPEPPDGPGG